MDKLWIRLIALAIITMLVVIGWDIFLSLTGAKSSKEYNVTEISPNLYGVTEEHLRNWSRFAEFPQTTSSATQQ